MLLGVYCRRLVAYHQNYGVGSKNVWRMSAYVQHAHTQTHTHILLHVFYFTFTLHALPCSFRQLQNETGNPSYYRGISSSSSSPLLPLSPLPCSIRPPSSPLSTGAIPLSLSGNLWSVSHSGRITGRLRALRGPAAVSTPPLLSSRRERKKPEQTYRRCGSHIKSGARP